MRYVAILLAFALGFTTAAQAAVTVEEQILQKGLFAKADCKLDPTDPSYDACQCDADIRYPKIRGLNNEAAQASLNASLKHMAEQAICEGKQVADPPKAQGKDQRSPSSASHHYEVTFESPSLVAFRVTDWGYSGGAHGNGTVTGAIVDLKAGKILSLSDIFAEKDMLALNQAIYDVLSSKPEEEVFRDQVESRKGTFIVGGVCQGCTLTLAPEGIKVVFQTYEVAPYAAGNTEVTIPVQYVSNPAIVAALAEQKKTATEKK